MSPRNESTEMRTRFRSDGIFGPASTTGVETDDEAIGAADESMTDPSCVSTFVFRLHADKPPAKAATQHHDTKIRPPCRRTRIATFNPKTSIKTQDAGACCIADTGTNLPHADTFFLA